MGPILQLGKLRHRTGKECAQGPIAPEWSGLESRLRAMLGVDSVYTNKERCKCGGKKWSLGFGAWFKRWGGCSWLPRLRASAQSQGQWEPWAVLEREP